MEEKKVTVPLAPTRDYKLSVPMNYSGKTNGSQLTWNWSGIASFYVSHPGSFSIPTKPLIIIKAWFDVIQYFPDSLFQDTKHVISAHRSS